MDNQVIFMTIAESLIGSGYDITLELKHYDRDSKVIGGMNTTKTLDTGLVLTATKPVADDEADEEEEEE